MHSQFNANKVLVQAAAKEHKPDLAGELRKKKSEKHIPDPEDEPKKKKKKKKVEEGEETKKEKHHMHDSIDDSGPPEQWSETKLRSKLLEHGIDFSWCKEKHELVILLQSKLDAQVHPRASMSVCAYVHEYVCKY